MPCLSGLPNCLAWKLNIQNEVFLQCKLLVHLNTLSQTPRQMKYIFRWLLSRFLWRQHAFIQFNTKLYETAVSIEFIFNLILLKHSIPRPSPSSPRFPLQQLHRRSLLRQLGRVSCRHRSHPWSGILQPFGWGQHRPGRRCRQAFLRKVKIWRETFYHN